jgi:hypothetical protein
MYGNFRNTRILNNLSFQVKPLRNDPLYQTSNLISSRLVWNQFGRPIVRRTDKDGAKQMGGAYDDINYAPYSETKNIYREALNKILTHDQMVESQSTPDRKASQVDEPLYPEEKDMEMSGSGYKINFKKFSHGFTEGLKGHRPPPYKKKQKRKPKLNAKKAIQMMARRQLQKHKVAKNKKEVAKLRDVVGKIMKGKGLQINKNLKMQVVQENMKQHDILKAEHKTKKRSSDPIRKLRTRYKKTVKGKQIKNKIRKKVKRKVDINLEKLKEKIASKLEN